MKQIFIIPCIMLVMSLGLVSCSDNDDDAPVVQTELTTPTVSWPLTRAQQAQVQGLNDFALRLLRTTVSHGDGRSIVMSPLSAAYVLGMAADGADGETRNEITATLGFRRGDAQAVDDLCASLISHTRTDGGCMHVANALFVKQGAELKQQFQARLTDAYDAEIAEVDFTQDATLDRINAWAEQHTNGMIPSILDDISPSTALCLINAVCMKAEWQQPFNAAHTGNKLFYFADRTSDFIPTMSQTAKMDYTTTAKGKLLQMPYKGGRYAMNIFLPNENISPLEALGTMSGSELCDLTESMQPTQVNVQLPLITTESDHDMSPLLKEMGIITAFDKDKADFHNITDTKNIFINKIFQKAIMRVDEAGTEAAAVTIVTGDIWDAGLERPIPVNFYANHQFLYFITDRDSGVIIFIGIYNGE